MKTITDYLVETGSVNRLVLYIGKEPNGYSCDKRHEDPLKGYVSLGGSNMAGDSYRVLLANYHIQPWYVIITDYEVIKRVTANPAEEWLDLIFGEVVQAFNSTNQMEVILQHTINVVWEKAFDKGKEAQKEINRRAFEEMGLV